MKATALQTDIASLFDSEFDRDEQLQLSPRCLNTFAQPIRRNGSTWKRRARTMKAGPDGARFREVAGVFGGGGGNRTRVRRPSTVRTTCLAWFFNAFALRPPTGRLTLG